MFQRIFAFILCALLLITSNVNVLAHDAFLDVSYDSCDAQKLANGMDEIWYEINDMIYPDKSVHLSHETKEIRYYFSDQSEWIDSVQQVALDNWQVVLTSDEAEDIVEQIQLVFVESMQKWNSVYYYSYDANGNQTANKIITITEGDFSNHNLVVEPVITTEFVARTIFSRSSWEYMYIQDYHHHSSSYTIKLNINDAYESIYQIQSETEAVLTALRENTGAHEIGHILGLGDLDALCESTCNCNECNNGDDKVCKGHHEEALMGYGQTEFRVTHVTYKDIAGVSITRRFHTDDNHLWMLRINDNSYDVVCALCNGVKFGIQDDVTKVNNVYYYLNEEIPLMGSCNQEHSLVGDNMILVASDGERFFYKCRYCRYIEEKEIATVNTIPQYNSINYLYDISSVNGEYHKIKVSFSTTYNFKSDENNDLDICLYNLYSENSSGINLINDDVNTENGCNVFLTPGTYYLYVENNTDCDLNFDFTVSPPPHIHSYTEWTKHSSTHHIECCECGLIGTTTAFHVIKAGSAVNNRAICMYCGAVILLGSDIVPVDPFSLTKVTLNGSYILPNGIIVLVDEDIEAYENGTLVFYDKDNLPQTQ